MSAANTSVDNMDFVLDLKVSEDEIVSTSQMATDHLSKLYIKFRDSRWSHDEDHDAYSRGLNAHAALLQLAKGGNTVRSIQSDLQILQDSLDYFKDTEESCKAFKKSERIRKAAARRATDCIETECACA